MYGVQAMFQHGIMAPLRLRDPALPPPGAQPQLAQVQPAYIHTYIHTSPPPAVQPAPPPLVQPAPPPPVQPSPPPQAYLMTPDLQGAGDAPQLRQRGAEGAVRRRRVQKDREAAAGAAAAAPPPRVPVETLGEEGYSQDETDSTEPGVQRYAQGDGDSEEHEFEAEEVVVEDEEESLRQAAPRTVAPDATKQAEAKAKPSDPKPTVPQAKRQDNVTQGGRGVITDDRNPAGLPGSTSEQVISNGPFGPVASLGAVSVSSLSATRRKSGECTRPAPKQAALT